MLLCWQHLMFGGNGCSMQMNRGNCEKRTSLRTSAGECSEHSAFESMWLSTNVNESALDWIEYEDCQVWHPEKLQGEQSVCWIQFFFFLIQDECWSAETLEGNLFVSQDAGIFNLLSCFQAQIPAKFDLLKKWKRGLAGIKIMLMEKLELHGNCPNSLLQCDASLSICDLPLVLHRAFLEVAGSVHMSAPRRHGC